jgi:hypothetical protein
MILRNGARGSMIAGAIAATCCLLGGCSSVQKPDTTPGTVTGFLSVNGTHGYGEAGTITILKNGGSKVFTETVALGKHFKTRLPAGSYVATGSETSSSASAIPCASKTFEVRAGKMIAIQLTCGG